MQHTEHNLWFYDDALYKSTFYLLTYLLTNSSLVESLGIWQPPILCKISSSQPNSFHSNSGVRATCVRAPDCIAVFLESESFCRQADGCSVGLVIPASDPHSV